MEKIIDTQNLHMAVNISGPSDGQPLILLHGWPDSWHTWDAMLPILHQAGYKTFVPSLRGFGHTCFRHEQTRRTGSFFALAQDIKDLIDVLQLGQVRLIGQDWGAFIALMMSNLWGTAIVRSSVVLAEGWQTFGNLSLDQIQNFWYQWFMTTEQGERYVCNHPLTFAEHMWQSWSPQYELTDADHADFEETFANPDWAAVTLDMYRSRWGYAPTDGNYAPLAERVQRNDRIAVPTLNIIGRADGCTDYHQASSMASFMDGPFKQELWPQAGHFLQREQPTRVANEAIQWFEHTK